MNLLVLALVHVVLILAACDGKTQKAIKDSHYDECEDLLETATYETHTLTELMYDFGCKPIGWEDFFDRADVVEMIQVISVQLQYDSQVQGLGINPDIGKIFRAFKN